jgi:hypothetical protein
MKKSRAPLRAVGGKKRKNVIKSPQQLHGNEYFLAVRELRLASLHYHDLLDEDITGLRGEIWDDITGKSQALCERFAWAVPDARALRVVANFGPLIEIGAGKGYWSRLLRDAGVDILAYDKFLPDRLSMWTEVKKGGAEVLSSAAAVGRNLFLCYPDEAESMAADCLERFTGEYIVHVGETIFTGTAMGAPVAPFGRTSSADFQVT